MLRTLFLNSIVPFFGTRGDAPGYIIKPRWGEGTNTVIDVQAQSETQAQTQSKSRSKQDLAGL